MKMKKYLMTGIAALALCVGFTSCSHDLEPMSQEDINKMEAQKIVDNYNKAFKAYVGGEIAPTQTWGFGTSAGTRTRAAGVYGTTGDMQPVEWYQDTNDGWKWKTRPYTFPSDCAATNFYAAVPGTVDKYTVVAGENQTGYASGVSYLDPSWTQEVNIWGNRDQAQQKTVGGTLYITGDNDFSNRNFTVCENTDVYLLEDATLTLNDNSASTIKFNLYIAPGAKLIANGSNGRVKLDNGAKLYNHGEIECKSFEVNNTSLFYNGSVGKLTTTGEVYVANAASVIVNDGEITSGTSTSKTGQLVTAGSGRVQNNAEWTVYGETIINSNYNVWVNNGHFITENYTYTATSSSVINNCFLTVNHNFCINIADGNGDFKIDSGGGVETEYFYGGGTFTAKDNNGDDVTFNGGPFKVTMGSRSVFKVAETAYMNALGSGIATAHYGFDGVGSDYAVLEAKSVVRQSSGEGNVAYSGNLYVSAEQHFEQGYSGQYPYIHYYNDCTENNIYAPGFKSGKPNISIAPTTCNPGFNYTPDPDTWFVRVMAEDLSASDDSDFDFNDVVIDVKYTKGESTADITLQAAGGTLPLRINGNDNLEVHKLFGFATNIMINTGWKGSNGATADPYEFTLPFSATTEAGFLTGVNNIKLEVEKTVNGEKKWLEMTAHEGEPASKFAVPSKIQWCAERESIKGKYELFAQWATSGDAYTFRWW